MQFNKRNQPQDLDSHREMDHLDHHHQKPHQVHNRATLPQTLGGGVGGGGGAAQAQTQWVEGQTQWVDQNEKWPNEPDLDDVIETIDIWRSPGPNLNATGQSSVEMEVPKWYGKRSLRFSVGFSVFFVSMFFAIPQTGLAVGFYLRKKETGHAGKRGLLCWARIWLCWACWAGLGSDLALLGWVRLGIWLWAGCAWGLALVW